MSYPGTGASSAAVRDALDEHVAAYASTLSVAGYARKSQYHKRRFAVRFVAWARRSAITASQLDEALLSKYLARGGRQPCAHERAALLQFLRHLRDVGAAEPRRASEPSAGDVLVRRYVGHLRDGMGLSVRSVEVYSPFVRAFVAAMRLPAHVATLDASAVRGYLLDRARGRSISYVRLLRAALCSFLRFLFQDGVTATDLSIAVPPVRRWRLAAVPPFLTPEEVERVLAATDRSTPRGLRAFAMLLLLARLGLRAGEVAALDLADVRWDVGEILVRGKGRVHEWLPLTKDVGEALACYLRDARGPSTSRRVFLRRVAPRVGLAGPTAVCVVAREALRRAGLRPPGRFGAHVFRHSLATRMIRSGASLGEIAQVLRHRSLGTTQLYAKVEFEALRGVALSWPSAQVRP